MFPDCNFGIVIDSYYTIMKKRKKHLLVAGNEEMLQFIITKVLSEAGYQVTTAKDGLEALYIINTFRITKKPFDLILIDSQLTILTSVELIEKLEKSKNNTPIIIITSSNNKISRDKFSKNTKIKFIEKPFPKEDLLKLIE